MIRLGDRARDRVTGLEGIVVARTKYLRGCDRLLLQPKASDDGKVPEPISCDEADVALIESTDLTAEGPDRAATGALAPSVRTSRTGGPRPDPRYR